MQARSVGRGVAAILVLSALGACGRAPPRAAKTAAPAAAPTAPATDATAFTLAGAMLAALESGKAQTWKEGDRAGVVKVTAAGERNGRPCRTYSVLDSGKESGVSLVCLDQDGSWRPASSDKPQDS